MRALAGKSEGKLQYTLLGRAERGELRNPTVETLEAIGQCYGLTIDEMLKLVLAPPRQPSVVEAAEQTEKRTKTSGDLARIEVLEQRVDEIHVLLTRIHAILVSMASTLAMNGTNPTTSLEDPDIEFERIRRGLGLPEQEPDH